MCGWMCMLDALKLDGNLRRAEWVLVTIAISGEACLLILMDEWKDERLWVMLILSLFYINKMKV